VLIPVTMSNAGSARLKAYRKRKGASAGAKAINPPRSAQRSVLASEAEVSAVGDVRYVPIGGTP